MKTNLHKLYQLDLDAAENGTWVNIGNGIEVMVARHNSAKFQKALRDELAPNKTKFKYAETEDQKAAILEEASKRAMARAILLDWKGILDEDGNEIPYSVETATDILLDQSMEPFFDLVDRASSNDETYRAEALAEAKEQAKN